LTTKGRDFNADHDTDGSGPHGNDCFGERVY